VNKRTKKLYSLLVRGFPERPVFMNESFLLLFFKKEALSS